MMKRLVYTDTSVIGGCLDAEYEEASRLLISALERGDATIVLSSLTQVELVSAPAPVQTLVAGIPNAHREYVEMASETAHLADRYINAGAIQQRLRPPSADPASRPLLICGCPAGPVPA